MCVRACHECRRATSWCTSTYSGTRTRGSSTSGREGAFRGPVSTEHRLSAHPPLTTTHHPPPTRQEFVDSGKGLFGPADCRFGRQDRRHVQGGTRAPLLLRLHHPQQPPATTQPPPNALPFPPPHRCGWCRTRSPSTSSPYSMVAWSSTRGKVRPWRSI